VSRRPARSRALSYAAVALAASSWGTWGIIVRHSESIAPIPAALQAAIVMGVITIVSGLVSLREPASRGRSWRDWARVSWFGVGDVMTVLLFFAAYKLTIAVAVLTHYMTPVLVALSAPVVLRERMTSRTTLAIAVSFAGLVMMLARSAGGDARGVSAMWTSAALGIASAVFYASNVLVNKFLVGAFSTSQATFWHGLVATALGLALVPPSSWPSVDLRAVAFLSVASIGPGAIGGLAFVWGLRGIPAAHASTLTLLEPLVSLSLGAAVLGERVAAPALLGGFLILAGAALVMTQAPAPVGGVRGA
jgi:drug/metabolite transporter (DMT)-like permease